MNNLKMPKSISGESIYIVEEGDTLCSVANKFKVSKRLIILDNNLKGELVTGQFLYIFKRGKTYLVKVDDTIEKIAKKFCVLPSEIKKINKIEYVYPNEIIEIPTNDYEEF